MAQMLKNNFIKPSNGLDFSRNLFPYEKRHSTNLLSGAIVPVNIQFLYPGMSPDYNFGAVIESAPLISTNLDNIYIDVICIWCPLRLVMTDWNEFLGESHTQAFTINRNITIPKITKVYNAHTLYQGTRYDASRSYVAEHYLSVHFGLRYHDTFDATLVVNNTYQRCIPNESIFKKGISVLPSRIYELNWNTFFRNENIQPPILIDKTSTFGSHDATYELGLGSILFANKLKTFYTTCTPAPSLLDVSIAMDQFLAPVGTVASASTTLGGQLLPGLLPGQSVSANSFYQFKMSANGTTESTNFGQAVADLSQLTVNRMYFALMEQRFANKMMKGRRAVEFYENFFGIRSSEAGHDMPQIICQKRFPLNISQVIATANSTDIQNNDQPIGSRGAFSVTGISGSLIKNFMATEHGYLQTYVVIRGQPSVSNGIDKHLGYDGLLDTYLPEFDHIGPVGIENLEIAECSYNLGSGYNFGFTNAWYQERKQISDVVGIMEPTEPLAYKTLALDYGSATGGISISDGFLRFRPTIIDRIFLFPVCYGTPGTVTTDGGKSYVVDTYGEPSDSNRYQFLIQFVVKGKFAAVMSQDSEPLQLRM